MTFTAHPHCGLATFVIADKKGNVTPVTRFVDVKGMFKKMEEMYRKIRKSALLARMTSKLKKKRDLRETSDKRSLLIKVSYQMDLIDILSELSLTHEKRALGKFTWRAMMIGGMHFQDSYRYGASKEMCYPLCCSRW